MQLCIVQEIHEGLDLSGDDEESFSIFSLKFSMDGQEIVAASSDDSIYVYDLVTNKRTLRIPAHKVFQYVNRNKFIALMYEGLTIYLSFYVH